MAVNNKHKSWVERIKSIFNAKGARIDYFSEDEYMLGIDDSDSGIRKLSHDLFKCKCGCGMMINPETKDKIDFMQELLDDWNTGINLEERISSGARCPLHNKNEGGKSDSSHTKGRAVDFSPLYGSRDRYYIVKAAMEAGFTRLGVGKNLIHVDDDPDKAPEVMWQY